MSEETRQSMIDEQRRQYEQKLIDYKTTFGSQGGQRVLEDLYKEGYLNDLTFIVGDTHATAFNEGKRYIALHIKRILEIS